MSGGARATRAVAAAAAAMVLAAAGACGPQETGDLAAFCAAWRDGTELVALLTNAPPAIEEVVGLYVAALQQPEVPEEELRAAIDEFVAERC